VKVFFFMGLLLPIGSSDGCVLLRGATESHLTY
jgi:hypothetical protein